MTSDTRYLLLPGILTKSYTIDKDYHIGLVVILGYDGKGNEGKSIQLLSLMIARDISIEG